MLLTLSFFPVSMISDLNGTLLPSKACNLIFVSFCYCYKSCCSIFKKAIYGHPSIRRSIRRSQHEEDLRRENTKVMCSNVFRNTGKSQKLPYVYCSEKTLVIARKINAV